MSCSYMYDVFVQWQGCLAWRNMNAPMTTVRTRPRARTRRAPTDARAGQATRGMTVSTTGTTATPHPVKMARSAQTCSTITNVTVHQATTVRVDLLPLHCPIGKCSKAV